MSILQATLLGLLYYFAKSPWPLGAGFLTFERPLVAGLFTGIILGEPVMGAMVGAQINILYLGFIGAGGAIPSDMTLAGIVGTALAISANLTVEASLAIAVPLGLLGTLIWVGKLTVNTFFVRYAEKFAQDGDTKKYWIADILMPQALLLVITFVPAFVMVYFGAEYIQSILDFLGGNVLRILTTIGGMMPALGIALTMQSIFKGESKIFFFLGFLLVQYFQLDLVALGLLSLVASIIYMQVSSKIEPEDNDELTVLETQEESSYVLLDKSTIRKSWLRWLMFYQSNYNYERMQGTGFLNGMVPVIQKLYPNDKEKRSELMVQHMQFFNTEARWGASIVGLTVAMEEKRAQGLEEITNETIASVKTGLMGPIAGIGDTISQAVYTPLLLSVCIALTLQGNIFGAVLYFVLQFAFVLGVSWTTYKLGYEKGNSAILNLLQSGKINKLILGASVMGCLVMGGLVGRFVKLSASINIPVGGENLFSIQTELFDALLPGLLPLALTLLCYKMLKKGWSSTKVMGLIAVIAVVGGVFKILV